MLRNLLAGAAALSLAATPAMAQTAANNSASKLSIAKSIPQSARTGPAMKQGRNAIDRGLLIGIVLVVVIVGGILIFGDDDPDSP